MGGKGRPPGSEFHPANPRGSIKMTASPGEETLRMRPVGVAAGREYR